MSKITNDGLTRSGTGCFIAVPIWQHWVSKVTYSNFVTIMTRSLNKGSSHCQSYHHTICALHDEALLVVYGLHRVCTVLASASVTSKFYSNICIFRFC